MIDLEFNRILASSLNLIPKYINRSMLPEMRARQKQLSRRDGFYDYGNNDFKERIITVEFSFKISNYNTIKESLRNIAEWLYTTEQKYLFFSDEYDKYYLARVYHPINWEEATALGKFTVNFTCQPWAFSAEDTNYTLSGITTSPYNIDFYNNGNKNISLQSSQGAYSLFTITGSYTTISLTLNGYTLSSSTAISSKTIEIDNVNLTIDKDSSNDLSDWTGDFDNFLPIIPKANTLTITGTGLNISVSLDYRQEWK